MGNLIKDFWTYEYKGTSYYGIIEVIKGEDLGQKRYERKYEQHIEKALEYTMKYDVISHMSIQTYCKGLKGRTQREENEQKYYPFVLEFESRDKYNEMVMEAAVYVQHLINNYDIAEEDILIMINNSKSVYVSVNPKVYGLKPSKVLHKVYTNMYQELKAELGFKFVDTSIVVSSYKVMKTPNTYYKNGYFVRISLEELSKLMVGSLTKEQLTIRKRNLNCSIPGQASLKFAKLYSNALKKALNKNNKVIKEENTEDQVAVGSCVRYFMQNLIDKGYRNFSLVSAGLYLKNNGYSQDEVREKLQALACSWNHDENANKINGKVKWIFRKNKRFSCEYAKKVFADLGIENMCSSCPYGGSCGKKKDNADTIIIDPEVINELWANNASTRHYIQYIQLLEKDLLNEEIMLSEVNINPRTIRELCKLDNKHFKREKKEGKVIIKYTSSNKGYELPKTFATSSMEQMGDSLKSFLKLLTKGYKVMDKFLLFRMTKETMAKELGYTDISALYKLIKKLKDLGYIKEHKNNVYALYFETYKVISINKEDEDMDTASAVGDYLTAVGEQMVMSELEKCHDIRRFIWDANNKIKPKDKGSPG